MAFNRGQIKYWGALRHRIMDEIDRIKRPVATRKIEKSDTYDYIKGHDPDYHKKESKHQKGWEDHEDDTAKISIESLIVFLHGLIKDHEEQQTKTSSDPIDKSMKQAINAYGSPKKPTEKRYTYLDDEHVKIDPTVVKELISSLNDIKENGYEKLPLIPAENFLKSIEKTVEKYSSL